MLAVRIQVVLTLVTIVAGRYDEPWVDVMVDREGEEEDASWVEVRNMEPSGDELDRLVDQFPAPDDWFEEWLD